MLVLSRHVGERIVIGDNIVVRILTIDRGRVRLGIAAPPEVRIDREEIRDILDRERSGKQFEDQPGE